MKNVLLASMTVAVFGLAGCALDGSSGGGAPATAAPSGPANITYAPPPPAPPGSGGGASSGSSTTAAAEACVADGNTVIQASGSGFCQIASDGTGYTLETYLDFRG